MENIKIKITGNEINEKGFMIPITWAEIIPELTKASRLRPDEEISALIVSEEGIKAVISRKKGPKKKLKATTSIDDAYLDKS